MLDEVAAERLRQYERRRWNKMTIEQKRAKALATALSMNPLMRHCMDCKYAETSGVPSCAYILIMKQRRPCPPGEACTVKVNKK